MRRVVLSLLLLSALRAQNPTDLFQKAPPAVEQALRARITKFYQYHVDGHVRLAEALVAEECKDFFFSVNKPKYVGFEIKDIVWSDNFTKAKAIVVGQMIIMLPGFTEKPMPVPHASRWKLVNGDWYWYVDMDEVNTTPFGRMKTGQAGGAPATIGAMPDAQQMARMLNAVKADKASLEFRAGEASTAQAVLTNQLQGSISLRLEAPRTSGLEAKLDPAELGPGGKSTLAVTWTPGSPVPKTPLRILVHVDPTNQVIPIQITFAAK